MNSYMEARAKLREAQRKFSEFEKEYRKKFFAKIGDRVLIKETGDTIVLGVVTILEDNGDWRFTWGYRVTKTGEIEKLRTFIKHEWHMIVNGIEYSCDWNNGF